MNPEGPPENRTGALAGAHPKTKNSARLVTDCPAFRNHRIVCVRYCLERDIWEWLEWTAASNTGGWLP